MKFKYLIFIIIAFAFVTVNAQQKVIVNGQSFKSNLEIVQAQISREKIAIVIDEIDKSDPKYQTDNCSNCQNGKTLILEVDFKRGFKFPIEETDSVFVNMSYLQEGLAEYNFNTAELDQLENSRDRKEEFNLQNNAETVKKKSQEITRKMQEGSLTPQEAEKQLMALIEPQMKALDNSTTMKNIDNIDAFENNKSTYDMHFYNDENLTETKAFSGYLFIKEFNSERFVAEYRGEVIEECVEKRKATSLDDEKKCGATISEFIPGAKVLSEGSGRIDINISIKEFINNR